MNLELSCQDGVTVARVLDAALDVVGADDFKKRIGARVEQGERLLAIDLSRVTFIDSGGLGALLSLVRQVEEGGRVVLCGCTPPVQQVLRLTRLDRVFDFYADTDAAVAALR